MFMVFYIKMEKLQIDNSKATPQIPKLKDVPESKTYKNMKKIAATLLSVFTVSTVSACELNIHSYKTDYKSPQLRRIEKEIYSIYWKKYNTPSYESNNPIDKEINKTLRAIQQTDNIKTKQRLLDYLDRLYSIKEKQNKVEQSESSEFSHPTDFSVIEKDSKTGSYRLIEQAWKKIRWKNAYIAKMVFRKKDWILSYRMTGIYWFYYNWAERIIYSIRKWFPNEEVARFPSFIDKQMYLYPWRCRYETDTIKFYDPYIGRKVKLKIRKKIFR